jgi:hypothetical protein
VIGDPLVRGNVMVPGRFAHPNSFPSRAGAGTHWIAASPMPANLSQIREQESDRASILSAREAISSDVSHFGIWMGAACDVC